MQLFLPWWGCQRLGESSENPRLPGRRRGPRWPHTLRISLEHNHPILPPGYMAAASITPKLMET